MHTLPAVKDLVLLGGGHSHVIVLRQFGMQPLPGLRLSLVARDIHTPYSGMLPGLIADHYGYDDCHIDLARLAHFAGATLIHAEAEGLDPERRRLYLPNRPPLRYDVLSINIGSRPPTLNVPGASEYALAVKPIDQFLHRWKELLTRFRCHSGPFRLLVAGAGAGGVELLLAVQHRLRQEQQYHGLRDVKLDAHLVSATDLILPGHNASVRSRFERVLRQRAIHVHNNVTVTRVEPESVTLSDGLILPTEAVFWVTGAGAPDWLATSGLATTEAGFVQLNPSLQSVSHPEVFAAGDIAHVVAHPRPKSGVFAVRQGPPLAANLRSVALGQAPREFRPQQHFLSLISTGDRYAVASRGQWSIAGAWTWRWKDYIDRAFMRRFSQLPSMSMPRSELPAGLADLQMQSELDTHPMRCGGCGAKLGSSLLREVLTELTDTTPAEVVIGLDQADDGAVLQGPSDKLWVQSVDYLRHCVDDPYRFGRIAAQHALSDLFAMGATPHSALAIVTLPYAAPGIQADQLRQLMAGAVAMLHEHQTVLIGGHSSEGAELSLGFCVNGFATTLLTKSGLQAGDALIVTQALGTGTLLAAAMQGRAKGYWLEQAYAQMEHSSQTAAAIVQRYGATACTDVTGFGLYGHLLEMLQASGVNAELDLDQLPAMPGALTCLAQGISSSLAPANQRNTHGLITGAEANNPRYALLFDPQTAGGLLAGIPHHQADDCVQALQAADYADAACIGRVQGATPRSATASPVRIYCRNTPTPKS